MDTEKITEEVAEEVKTEETVQTEEIKSEENIVKNSTENTENKTDTTTEKVRFNTQSKILITIIVILTLLLIGICTYVGVTSKNQSGTTKSAGTTANKSVLVEALNNLKRKDTFIISTYISAPMGDSSYIEYVTPQFSATMIDENNMEVPYQQIDLANAHYKYNDLIKDGHMYFFYEESEDENKVVTQTYISPDNYVKECEPRRYMFFDLMKDNIKDLKFEQTTSIDLGNGEVSMDIYSGVISSDIVKKILGNGTVALYSCVKDSTNNEGLKKMMGWLIDDIEFTLVYSDAKILVGVVDDTLAYVNLEIGGLGTKMYVTKCYIENTDAVKNIEMPSIEGAVTYENLYADYADMALNFDSMEEMYNALYNTNNTITEDELQQMLDNAVEEDVKKQESEQNTTSEDVTNSSTNSSTNVTATPTPTVTTTPTPTPKSETK